MSDITVKKMRTTFGSTPKKVSQNIYSHWHYTIIYHGTQQSCYRHKINIGAGELERA